MKLPYVQICSLGAAELCDRCAAPVEMNFSLTELLYRSLYELAHISLFKCLAK